MSERKLIHKTKKGEFFSYLRDFYGAIDQPLKPGECARFSTLAGTVSFSLRKHSDHLTTWGLGTKLAKQFINYKKSKGTVNERDFLPTITVGSDEKREGRTKK